MLATYCYRRYASFFRTHRLHAASIRFLAFLLPAIYQSAQFANMLRNLEIPHEQFANFWPKPGLNSNLNPNFNPNPDPNLTLLTQAKSRSVFWIAQTYKLTFTLLCLCYFTSTTNRSITIIIIIITTFAVFIHSTDDNEVSFLATLSQEFDISQCWRLESRVVMQTVCVVEYLPIETKARRSLNSCKNINGADQREPSRDVRTSWEFLTRRADNEHCHCRFQVAWYRSIDARLSRLTDNRSSRRSRSVAEAKVLAAEATAVMALISRVRVVCQPPLNTCKCDACGIGRPSTKTCMQAWPWRHIVAINDTDANRLSSKFDNRTICRSVTRCELGSTQSTRTCNEFICNNWSRAFCRSFASKGSMLSTYRHYRICSQYDVDRLPARRPDWFDTVRQLAEFIAASRLYPSSFYWRDMRINDDLDWASRSLQLLQIFLNPISWIIYSTY